VCVYVCVCVCVELPTFLFLKDLATDPKTLRLLSQSLSDGTAPCCKGRWGVGGSTIRHKLSYPLKGNEKVYRIF